MTAIGGPEIEPGRESIWSVARRLRPLFSVILIVQFLGFLGLNAYRVATGGNPGDALDIITGAYKETSSQSFSILLMAYTLTEVIMLASWLRERDQEREQKAKEQGLQEGRQEGRQEGQEVKDREWRAWYERYQVALREGREFSEPPPERPVDKEGN